MSRALFVTPLRRAHAIAPFGPGAITLLRNRVSAVVTAPATWMRSLPIRTPGSVSMLDELTITDRHLTAETSVARFVMPWAAGDDPNSKVDWIMPAARFPLMEACANPDCRRLVRRDPADTKDGRCEQCTSAAKKRGKWPTFQTAVVLCCPAGHLDDVDWDGWLHARPGNACARSDVRYQVSGAADRPTLSCRTCDRKAQFDPNETFPCTGARPWLPHAGSEACAGRARPIERTSASVYYAWQLSSLTIPVPGADNPALLHALADNPTLKTLRGLARTGEIVENMTTVANKLGIRTDADEVTRHLNALEGERVLGTSRAAELTALQSTEHRRRPTGSLPDLIAEPQDVTGYRGSRLGDRLAGVSLVPRLRETRVLAGFSRVEPVPPNHDLGYVQMWGKKRPEVFAEHATEDWLPGYQVFGEGILCVLDPDAVDRWTARVAGDARLDRAAAWAAKQVEPARPLPWLLAHTLAHLVMRAAAPHAGYPLPSLRERIFAVDQRTGFLVYTAAGDVHGTLGGLVELGTPDRLGDLLEAAVDSAFWCATDPVCMEGEFARRGAGATPPGACHHCLLVPETSCESFNRGLDRAAVIGRDDIAGFLH